MIDRTNVHSESSWRRLSTLLEMTQDHLGDNTESSWLEMTGFTWK